MRRTENKSRTKEQKWIYKIGTRLIIVLFTVLALYLFLLAGFSTTTIDVQNEHSFLVKDSMLRNTALSAVFLSVSFWMWKRCRWFAEFVTRINTDRSYYRKCRRIALVVLGAVSAAFLVGLQAGPKSDQAYISAAAAGMMNHDYSAFGRGEYMEQYPHQMGIVLFLYILAHICGSGNYLAFQILNVGALLLIYWNFAELSDLTGHQNFVGLVIVWCGFLFVPAILYTSFIYGNLLGLSMSLCADRHFFRIFVGRERNAGSKDAALRMSIQPKAAVWGEILLGLVETYAAVAFKSNYQIFAIGAGIVVILMTLRSKQRVRIWIRAVVCVLGIAVILLYGSRAMNKAAGKLFGVDLSGGVSHWAWVAMGLQENDGKYDGWYNGYTLATYYEAGSSAERQEPVVKEYIRNRLQEFVDNPEAAVHFFAGKNASQWNNPTFQAFYCVRDMSNTVSRSKIFSALLSVSGERRIGTFLNLFQFIVLFGSVLYAFIGIRREQNPFSVYYMVIIIGGFLFHTFWEAKAQYIFTYFMLFIPLGVYGLEIVYEFLGEPVRENEIERGQSNAIAVKEKMRAPIVRVTAALLIIAGCIFVLGKLGNQFCQDVFLRAEGTGAYQELVKEYDYVKLPEGAYIEDVAGHRVEFMSSEYNNSCCLYTSDGLILRAADREDGYAAASFENGTTFVEDGACYIQKANEEGGYYIIHMYGRDQYLLTRGTEGELYFTSRSGEANQIWEITSAD